MNMNPNLMVIFTKFYEYYFVRSWFAFPSHLKNKYVLILLRFLPEKYLLIISILEYFFLEMIKSNARIFRPKITLFRNMEVQKPISIPIENYL